MANELKVGDDIPADCELIEVHVPELRLLFNPIDPSPPRERDLDAKAEEFIVSWARSLRRDARLALQVGGWVAMWRPLEIFLYDWWPILAERKLYDRLSVMPVNVRFRAATPTPTRQ